MIFFLTFPSLLTLVPKSEADASETSDWLEHWGIINKEIISPRSLIMYFRKHNVFSTFLTLFFINSEHLGEISTSGKKSEALYDLFNRSLFKIEVLNLIGEILTLVTGVLSLLFPS